MAYNVFKRPMFKRGGSTTGTGIMSHVEPRVNAAMGFPNFGVTQMPPQSQLDAFRQAEIARQNRLSKDFNILGPAFTMPENYPGGFPEYRKFLEKQKQEQKEFQNVIEGPDSGIATIKPGQSAFDAVFAPVDLEMEKQKAEKQKLLEDKPDPGKNEPAYEGTDISSEVEKEANMLKELLKKDGDKYSKGEAALIIAGALAEPGSFADKVKKATELAAPVARKAREEDKAITLAAYKLAKEKEIAGAKQTQQEKLIDEYVSANIKDPANTKSANELRREAVNKYFGGKEDTQKEYNVAQLAQYETPDKSSGKSLLTKALEDKAELEALKANNKKLNENQEQKLARSIAIIEKVKELRTSIGFTGLASGGRVGFAEGSEDVDTTDTLKKDIDQAVKPIEATNVAEGDQSVPMKPVQKLSFEELRNRLPKEITNDVVQLIANSEEALQDFAYIRDQEDVNSFNVKYGVNLILPPETV
jgi:hypothetical protein